MPALILSRRAFQSMRKIPSVTLIFSLFLLTRPALVQADSLDAHTGSLDVQNCHQLTLGDPLNGWPRSLSWLSDEDLLVVDSKESRIWRIDLNVTDANGKVPVVDALEQDRYDLNKLDRVFAIHATTSGFLLENRSTTKEIVQFDTSLLGRTQKKFRPKGVMIGSRELVSTFDWEPMGDGILTFGLLKGKGTDDWQGSFLYLDKSSDGETKGRIVLTVMSSLTSAVRFHYLSDINYIVATSSRSAYLLLMGPSSSIAEVQLGDKGEADQIRILEPLPEGFRARPTFRHDDRWGGARRATENLKDVENSSLPAGLFAWQGFLYLLAKGRMDELGETPWWLIKLDPSDGMELARFRLPTSAAHLVVTPGRSFWALLERDPVQGIGPYHAPYLPTNQILLVPGAWLEEPYKGRLSETYRITCQHE